MSGAVLDSRFLLERLKIRREQGIDKGINMIFQKVYERFGIAKYQHENCTYEVILEGNIGYSVQPNNRNGMCLIAALKRDEKTHGIVFPEYTSFVSW